MVKLQFCEMATKILIGLPHVGRKFLEGIKQPYGIQPISGVGQIWVNGLKGVYLYNYIYKYIYTVWIKDVGFIYSFKSSIVVYKGNLYVFL